MAKDARIHFRLREDLRERLLHVCKITGLDEPTIIRACIEAFIDHVESTGEIRLPLAVIPKSEAGKKTSGGAPSAREKYFHSTAAESDPRLNELSEDPTSKKGI